MPETTVSPVEAKDMVTTVSYYLPIPIVMWVTNEANRIAAETGARPNKSEVVKRAISHYIRESQYEERVS